MLCWWRRCELRPPDVLAPQLVHSLSHAWFGSSHEWLDEGVAQFMSLLWLEQTQGREVAVQRLQQEAKSLALAEPAPAGMRAMRARV